MNFKRVLALVLALTMIFSLAMPSAWAFDGEEDFIVEYVDDAYNDAAAEEAVVYDEIYEEEAIAPEAEEIVVEEEPVAVEEPAEEVVIAEEAPVEEAVVEAAPAEEAVVEAAEGFSVDDSATFNAAIAAIINYEDTESGFERYSTLDAAIAAAGGEGEYGSLSKEVILRTNGTIENPITNTVTINNDGSNAYTISGFTVDGGDVTLANVSVTGVVTVESGKLTTIAPSSIAVGTVLGNVMLNGGTATLHGNAADITVGENATLNISDGNYGFVTGTGKGNVTGGTFERLMKVLLAPGYYYADASGADYGKGLVSKIMPENAFAQVDDLYFMSHEDAFAYSQNINILKEDPAGITLTAEKPSVRLTGNISVANVYTDDPAKTTIVKTVDGDNTIYTRKPVVATIGDMTYASLEAAFAAAVDGDTIKLVQDYSGNGIKAPQGMFNDKGLTVDFGGFTYTVDANTVGSTGTETQAFQLLKDNKITFKNGTIYSEVAKMLVQNYSNLTLDNMILSLNNANYKGAYTLSNNNGDIVINDTTINANSNDDSAFAFDVCRYSSYPSVSVTVKGNSVINGNVELYASQSDAKDGMSLDLVSGTINGNIVADPSVETIITTNPDKISVTKASTFTQKAPEGYEWDDTGKLAKTWTVSFMYNDEAIEGDAFKTQTVFDSQFAQAPAEAPVQAGRTFVCWIKGTAEDAAAAEDADAFNFETTEITDDIVLSAKFEAIKYNITMVKGTGWAAGAKFGLPATYTIDDLINADIVAQEMTWTNYQFKNFKYASNDDPAFVPGENDWIALEDHVPFTITKDSKLTNYWVSADRTVNEYNITIDLNGGVLPEGETNPTTYTYDSPAITLVNPTRDHYEFAGWTGTGISGTDPVKEVTIARRSSGEREYTATWTPIEYTITFAGLDKNTNPKSLDPIKYTVETAQKVTDNPTKSNYVFQGWEVSATTEGDEVNFVLEAAEGENVATMIPAGSYGNVTLTALWQGKDITITLNGNGGTTADGEETIVVNAHYGDVFDKAAYENAFTREHYHLTEWKRPLPSSATATATYTAQWAKDTYTVQFNANGGEGAMADQTFTYDVEQALTQNGFNNASAKFMGWATTQEDADALKVTYADNATVSNLSPENNATVTLYAVWESEAFLTDKGGYKHYQATIDDAIKFRADYSTGAEGYDWFDATTPIKLNADAEYTLSEEKPPLTIDLNGHTLDVKPANNSGAESDAAPTDDIYVTEPVLNEDGTTTYSIAHYIAYVESVVNTYEYTKQHNGDWTTTKTGSTTTYTLFDTFANAADFALAAPEAVPDPSGKGPSEETIRTVYLLNANPVTYMLTKENLGDKELRIFLGEQKTANVGADAGTRYNYTKPDPNGRLFIYTLVDTVTVTFDLNGGTSDAPAAQTIDKGSVAKAPAVPTRDDGYDFDGWYNGETKFDFTAPVEENTALTAHWALHAYNIRYTNMGGVETNPNPLTYTIDKLPITLQDVEAYGWDFQGWTMDGNAVTVIPAGTIGDLSIRSEWVRHQFDVSFVDPDGGTTTEAQKVDYESMAKKPTDPTRDGYTFKGWKLADAEDMFVFETTPIEADIELTAVWEATAQRINYVLRGGENNTANPATYTIEDDPITLEDATRENWTFAGWTIPQLEINTATMKPVIPTGTTYNPLNVGARWTYSVTFDPQNGDESVTTQGIAQNALVTKPATDPEKTGYEFVGWYEGTLKEDGTIEYKDDAYDFTKASENGNLTLYAKYDLVMYKLTVDPNTGTTFSGSAAPVVLKYAYGDTVGTIGDAKKTGYDFVGWFNAAEGGEQVQIPATMPDEDVTIYAQYKIHTYKITVKRDNGTTDQVYEFEFGATVEGVDLTQPTRQNFNFKQWTFTPEMNALPETMPANDITVKAEWDGLTRYITFMDTDSGIVFASERIPAGTSLSEITPTYAEVVDQMGDLGYKYIDALDMWDPAIAEDEEVSVNKVYKLKIKDYLTVTFEANGATLDDRTVTKIKSGETIPVEKEPVVLDDNNKQALWLINGDPEKYFTFDDTPVTASMNLVATWVEEPEVVYADFSYNMSLADNLNLKYYVRNVRDGFDYSKFEIVVTVNGEAGTTIETFTLDNANENVFTIASLDARRMTDNINIVVKYNDKEVKNDNYSIQAYCNSVKARSTSTELTALIDAVLAYGANAQLTLGYNVDVLPTDSYDVTGVNIDPASTSKLGNVTGVNAFANRVLVDSTVTLQVLIRLNSDANLDDLTIYVDNQVYDKANLIKQSTNIYVVSIPVSALKLDVNHSVIVTNEDGTMAVYTVSAQVPMSRTNNDLAKALWAYFKAANEFYGTL